MAKLKVGDKVKILHCKGMFNSKGLESNTTKKYKNKKTTIESIDTSTGDFLPYRLKGLPCFWGDNNIRKID